MYNSITHYIYRINLEPVFEKHILYPRKLTHRVSRRYACVDVSPASTGWWTYNRSFCMRRDARYRAFSGGWSTNNAERKSSDIGCRHIVFSCALAETFAQCLRFGRFCVFSGARSELVVPRKRKQKLLSKRLKNK